MTQQMPQGPPQRRMSPEEMIALQDEEKQRRFEMFPPQEGLCLFCMKPLHPLENRNYDATTKGHCNKLCAKGRYKKLVAEGMDAGEVDKACWVE